MYISVESVADQKINEDWVLPLNGAANDEVIQQIEFPQFSRHPSILSLKTNQ